MVKLKASIKELNKAGTYHTSTTQEYSRSLNRISESTFGRDEEDDIGVAFQKFAIVTRQLSELMKDLVSIQSSELKNFYEIYYLAGFIDLLIVMHLINCLQMTNLDNIIMFPVDRLLKTELRGSKGDLKRPFDRAWKDYQDKYADLERQKKKAAKEAGTDRICKVYFIICNANYL